MHLPQLRPLEVTLSTKLSKDNILMRNFLRLSPMRETYSGKRYQDLITADNKILKVENESRCGHKNALIVQDDFTN